jgi:formylglycine-generating enzyme required for sulfatase activity
VSFTILPTIQEEIEGDLETVRDMRWPHGIRLHVAKHETTVGEYRQFCAATGRSLPPQPPGGSDAFPIVNVDWHDAVAYCGWRGGRLPTRREWKAMLGEWGEQNHWWLGDREASGGNEARLRGTGVGTAAPSRPVGGNPRDISPDGIMDLCGGVAEWLLDGSDEHESFGAWIGELGTEMWPPNINEFPYSCRLVLRNETVDGRGFRVVLDCEPTR